ncbi:hypothetical protein JYU34_014206 [Plutella xylostella]|uniref:Uncharacterized protein n=1 Tax=Plutella xylostella TaxID=51655 RepID=A0ABQ7Q7S3_PLUXY|nr:hypothetical protein JYU34_014206 [Plutella xylostella]
MLDRVTLQKRLFKNGIATSNLKLDTDVAFTDLTVSQTKTAVVLNTSYSGWYNVLETCDYEHSFRHPFLWLIFSDDLENTAAILSKYPIEVDSSVLIITKTDDNSYQLYEAYNTGFYTHGSFVVNSLGSWNNSRLHMKESRRTNMTGVVLKCMVVVTQMLTNETLPSFLEQSRPSGFDLLHKKKYFTLLKYLRDMYNFNYELKRTTSWGYLNESAGGAFDGMIGALQRGEIDIGGSPVFFRAERFKVLDYYMETWRSKQCFIFRHPKRVGAFYTIFTRPLSTSVWLSTALLLALSSAMLGLLLRTRALRTRGDDDDESMSIALLSIWSAVCQQGMTVQRNSSAVKLVIFSTFVFSLTLYQYYNAVVVSTLLREPPKNIRSLEDLLKSDLKTGVEDVLYNIDFFRHTTNPIAIQLYNEKVVTHNQRNFFKADYGMARVKQGGFAFHVDSSSGYRIMRRTFVEREVCEVQEVPLFPPQNMVATVKKGSPYKGILAYGLRKMAESGLMHRIRTVWDEPKPACVRTPDSSVFSVSVVEFSTPLLLLACGVVLALIVLAGEIAVCRWQRNGSKVKVLREVGGRMVVVMKGCLGK